MGSEPTKVLDSQPAVIPDKNKICGAGKSDDKFESKESDCKQKKRKRIKHRG